MKRATKINIVRIIVISGFLLFLELITRAGYVRPTILVPPSIMCLTLFRSISSGNLTPHFVRTLGEILLSFSMSSIIGIPIGILFWKFPRIWRMFEIYFVSSYAMPTIFFYPVLLVLFGLGTIPILIIAIITSMLPIILNTTTGFREIREVYPKVGHMFNCTTAQMFFKVKFPAAAPLIFAGLKMGFTYATTLCIAMEFLNAEKGLGFLVSYHYFTFDTDLLYAYILLIIIIAVTVNIIILRIEQRVRMEL